MKNELIKQMNDVILQESPKLHEILEKVIDKVAEIFNAKEKGPQLLFSPREATFISDIDQNTRLVIQRDFANLGIGIDVITQEGTIAHAILDTRNGFNEQCGRLPKELKATVTEIFDAISEIDINATDEEVPVPTEETPTVPASDVDVIEPQQ